MHPVLIATTPHLPVWAFAVGFAVFLAAAKSALSGRHRKTQQDPQRVFTQAQRTTIFARCGNRCESKRWFWSRCRSVPTHADHIYPWSKGGSTSLANAQGLCARHNLMKASHVPSGLYVRSLERRRKAYFPAGMPTAVVWQIGGR